MQCSHLLHLILESIQVITAHGDDNQSLSKETALRPRLSQGLASVTT